MPNDQRTPLDEVRDAAPHPPIPRVERGEDRGWRDVDAVFREPAPVAARPSP